MKTFEDTTSGKTIYGTPKIRAIVLATPVFFHRDADISPSTHTLMLHVFSPFADRCIQARHSLN